jgi:UDPglucose 6-dehydrogenase
VIESLKCAEELRVHDPYLDKIAGVSTLKDAKKALAGADLAIFMVSHKAYKTLTPATLKKLMRTPVVVDGRNLFDTEKMRRAGMIYRGVGKKVI